MPEVRGISAVQKVHERGLIMFNLQPLVCQCAMSPGKSFCFPGMESMESNFFWSWRSQTSRWLQLGENTVFSSEHG